jgi:hypothetical protein
MRGSDALDYVMKCPDCDVADAFVQLQQAVCDRVVDVRERGPAADRQRALLNDRGLRSDDAAWRIRFIGLAVPPEKVRDVLETCEFRRESVQSMWPPPDAAPEANRVESRDGAPAGASTSSSQAHHTAKRHNGRDYRSLDAPLVAEMHELIEGGEARSAEDAARAVVNRAAGGGQEDSRVKRLALRYREQHPVGPAE